MKIRNENENSSPTAYGTSRQARRAGGFSAARSVTGLWRRRTYVLLKTCFTCQRPLNWRQMQNVARAGAGLKEVRSGKVEVRKGKAVARAEVAG